MMTKVVATLLGPSTKQLAAVVALTADRRFEHFVKTVADTEEVWGLYRDGWALAATDDGTEVFPVWPARAYAEICARQEWAGYTPRSFPLDEFTGLLLPKLKGDGVLAGVFYVPGGKGATPSVEQLQAALEAELDKY